MTPDVIKVEAAPDFTVVAEFETGERLRFDMRPYLDYPAFAALKEPGRVRTAYHPAPRLTRTPPTGHDA